MHNSHTPSTQLVGVKPLPDAQNLQPVAQKQRYVILDAVRGFALLGIVLANFPEFGLWTFLGSAEQQTLSTAHVDKVVRWLTVFLVDGKFYTIFSFLFGMGFSIILQNALKKGKSGIALFYRRMAILAVVGFAHMMLLWSGDILLLYALVGMLLPLFARLRLRTLTIVAAVLWFLPVVFAKVFPENGDALTVWLYDKWWSVAAENGITAENFAVFLRDAQGYSDVFRFLCQGAVERMWEFASGYRVCKVLALFLLGYVAGKSELHKRVSDIHTDLEFATFSLRSITLYLLALALPFTSVYLLMEIYPVRLPNVVFALFYALGVLPMALVYVLWLCRFYRKNPHHRLFSFLSAPGRMALSCYIGQTLVGMWLFYGTGLGLGADMGLVWIELLAVATFCMEALLCRLWLRWFRYGPFEWLWRMLTYGHYLPLRA